jgi:hypothetical protein
MEIDYDKEEPVEIKYQLIIYIGNERIQSQILAPKEILRYVKQAKKSEKTLKEYKKLVKEKAFV